mgnify:CR=1 FL=1
MLKLESTIAAAARERDLKDKQTRDDIAANERQRDEAIAIWSARKKELPDLVKAIDTMLKQHGYVGLTRGVFDQKHADIDRAVINFEHNARSHSKIMLRATRTGELVCSIGAVSGDVYSAALPIRELTAERLKEVIARAVGECLTGEWAPRSERSIKPA